MGQAEERIKQSSFCIDTEVQATQLFIMVFLFNITNWEFVDDPVLKQQMLEDESWDWKPQGILYLIIFSPSTIIK